MVKSRKKSKSHKPATPKPEPKPAPLVIELALNEAPDDDIEEPEANDDVEVASSVLSALDRRFLQRVSKFLFAVLDSNTMDRANREGYTMQEHLEGWRLLRLAGGEQTPVDNCFAGASADGAHDGEQMLNLQQTDAFENLWFPRTRMIIRRVVSVDQRGAFEAGFFKDLEQQPLGPTVIGSVSTYLNRVEGLETSSQPGAKDVRETLRKRGLTPARIKRMRALLESLTRPAKERPRMVSPEELARVQDTQREALSQLRGWYGDWSTTLRPLFSVRTLVILGLMKLARSSKTAEPDPIEDDAPASVAAATG